MNSAPNSRLGGNVRAMTFNIRGSYQRDGENAWCNRRDLNITVIQDQDPDIIAFQEAQTGNLQDYKDVLGGDYDFFVGHVCKREMKWNIWDVVDIWKESTSVESAIWGLHAYIFSNLGEFSQQDEHVPIYWKREHFESVRAGAFYLSPTPEVESCGWESKLIRAATWVILREKTSRAECIVVNTHFPHENDKATKTECSLVILQQLAILAPDLPHIVLGDFNIHANIRNEAYSVFLQNGYQDTYKDTGTINTFHNFQGSDCPLNLGRIDWILVKNQPVSEYPQAKLTTIKGACVIRDAEVPVYPSDHYPVVADFTLTKLA